jgi:hypothetical protein
MKKFVLLLSILYSINCYAQWTPYDRSYYQEYTPMSPSEAMLMGRLKAEADARNRAAFNHYRELAYQSLSRGDNRSFITLSNTALSYGWRNSKLYYDRGLIYKELGLKKYAKREFKRAKRNGYPISNRMIRDLLKQK